MRICNVSSRAQASLQGAGFVPDLAKCTGVPQEGHRGPQRPGLVRGLESGPPCSGQGEDFEFTFEAAWEELGTSSVVLPGCEDRPNSPADGKGDCWDFMSHLAMASEAGAD